MDRRDVLHAAEGCVCGQRQQDYGRPENNFARIAGLWEAYTGHEYSPVDVAVMLTLLKVARIASGRLHEDNFVDACGYMALAGELAAAEDARRRAAGDGDKIQDAREVCAGWGSDQRGTVAIKVPNTAAVGAAVRGLMEAVHGALGASEAGDPLAAGPGPVAGDPGALGGSEAVEGGSRWTAEDRAALDLHYRGQLEALRQSRARDAARCHEEDKELMDAVLEILDGDKPRPAAGAAVAVADCEPDRPADDHCADDRKMALEASEAVELPAWMTEPRVHGAPCLDGLGACEGVETVTAQTLDGEAHTIPVAVDPAAAVLDGIARSHAAAYPRAAGPQGMALPVSEAVSDAARIINTGGACIRQSVEQLARNLQRTARR